IVKLKLTFFATIISLHSALLMYCVNKSLSPSLQESNNCSFRLFGFGSLRHIVTLQNIVRNIPTYTDRNHGNYDFLRNISKDSEFVAGYIKSSKWIGKMRGWSCYNYMLEDKANMMIQWNFFYLQYSVFYCGLSN